MIVSLSLKKNLVLKFNKDFFGYSPERINPGDKKRTLTKIMKITSGSNLEVAKKVDRLYSSIISAGTFLANSIRVAEAAKVIENCQRDINIAFINELSIIFDKMNLDTKEVLEAAGTNGIFKFHSRFSWRSLHRSRSSLSNSQAEQLGYKSSVMSAGRKLNESLVDYISSNILDFLKQSSSKKSNILILGVTFKENCPDTRNSKVFEVYNNLKKNGLNIDAYDPFASKEEVLKHYRLALIDYDEIKKNFTIVF